MGLTLNLLIRPATALVAMLAVVSFVVAFTPFSQTFPSVGVIGDLVQNCTSPTSLVQKEPAGSLELGYDGGVTFWCDNPTSPAFGVGGGTIQVTPTFTLPTGNYTDLYIFDSTDSLIPAENCTDLLGFQLLESGVEESIPQGNYNYCAQVVNAQTSLLGTFDIQWDV